MRRVIVTALKYLSINLSESCRGAATRGNPVIISTATEPPRRRLEIQIGFCRRASVIRKFIYPDNRLTTAETRITACRSSAISTRFPRLYRFRLASICIRIIGRYPLLMAKAHTHRPLENRPSVLRQKLTRDITISIVC